MNDSKAVLITGCSSGIGKATALHLASSRDVHGWTIWASARKPETLRDLEVAGCRTIALDVQDHASMTKAVRTIEREHGAVSVLVNNAGYGQPGAIEAVPFDNVRGQFETNVFGPIRLIQLALPAMRSRHSGRIVNLSSIGGRLTFPGGGYYHATKHAVEAISDALRFEVRGFGIDVVIIEPGMIRSKFGETLLDQMVPTDGPYAAFHAALGKATNSFYENSLISRLAGTPEDVARTIERAITVKRPRARYTVSPSATFFLTQRRLLSDRAWDGLMRLNFPSPGETERMTS